MDDGPAGSRWGDSAKVKAKFYVFVVQTVVMPSMLSPSE